MRGCGEANIGGGTAGDWAVAVNEKANVRTGTHEKTSVESLKQFLMRMGTTFRTGATKGLETSGGGIDPLPFNDTKENLGRAYRRLRMSHASRYFPISKGDQPPQLAGIQSVVASAFQKQMAKARGVEEEGKDAKNCVGRVGFSGCVVHPEDSVGIRSNHGKMDVCV